MVVLDCLYPGFTFTTGHIVDTLQINAPASHSDRPSDVVQNNEISTTVVVHVKKIW